MSQPAPAIEIALLAMPQVTASTVYGIYEILLSAERDWSFLTTGVPGTSRFRPRILSTDGQPFHAANGLLITPEATLADYPAPDVICIADLFVAPEDDIHGRYDREVEWLRGAYAAGSTIATACSGALLLAETGLLADEDATTHWAYCDAMAERYPDIRLHPSRALIITGSEQRLIMAGGGSSWHDLTLYLIARFLGVEEAMQVARLHLLDWHHIGQQPFATLLRNHRVEDAVIADAQTWIAQNYDLASPVTAMVDRSGLSDRSFKRRFAQATGMSPLEYVHTVRLEEAKQMLETGDLPVEAIANEVGYEDASFFGRLFRRQVGLTPAQYRRRFGSIRRALQAQ